MVGPPNVLVIDAATFVVAAALVGCFTRVATIDTNGFARGVRGYLRQLGDGFRYLRGDRLIRAILVTVAITNALSAGWSTVLLPAYGSTTSGGGLLVGSLMAGYLVGSMLGSVLYGTGVLLDSVGLATTLLILAGLYLVATLCPLMFRVWRQMDERPASLADLSPTVA